jgi:hypothetical protein
MATLSHSASKQKSHSKNGLVPSHMMRLHAKAASKDFLALIGIFRYHLKNQELKIASENPPTEKESQALAKTFLRIHKTWDRYNSMLHPPVSQEAYEQERSAQKQAAQVEMEEKELSPEPTIESSSLLPQADSNSELTQNIEEISSQEINVLAVLSVENTIPLEENPLHPIQNNPNADDCLAAQKRKFRFLLPLAMQDSQSIAKERPWLKVRYTVCENIDTQIAPSYNRWIVA